MSQSIKSLLVVLGKDAHGLLTHRALICVSRRLIVIRKGNCAGDGSQDHTGVNLSVAVGRRLRLRHGHEGIRVHGDHGLLGLTGIQIVQEVVAARSLPAEEFLPGGTGRNGRQENLSLPVTSSRNIQEGRRIIQRPNETSGLRGNPEFLDCRLPDKGNLSLNESGPLRLSESLNTFKRLGRRKHPDPLSIQEDAGSLEQVFNRETTNGLEFWHGMDILGHNTRVAELGDTGRAGQVLDNSYTVALRSLIRTDETPLGVVELAGCDELSCGLLNRC